jgi:hypothetical protein
MKKGIAFALVLLCGGGLTAAAEHDNYGQVITWRNIVGVITAPGVDNPVAVIANQTEELVEGPPVTLPPSGQISSGTLPWVTRSGSARVDLTSGHVQFNVNGLVLIGGNGSGTAGSVDQVIGTLVCNPGSTDASQLQAIVDTPPVALSTLGNARFSGQLTGDVPFPCSNPLFLIRVGPDLGEFAGLWIATGVEPSLGGSSDSRGDRDRDDRR